MPTRKTRHGYGYRARNLSSKITHTVFKPIDGWVGGDALDAPPGSCVSGKNIWIENNSLVPRPGLTSVGTVDFLSGPITGIATYVRSDPTGVRAYPIQDYLFAASKEQLTSQATFAMGTPSYSQHTEAWVSWKTMSIESAGGKTYSDTLAIGRSRLMSSSVYLERLGYPVLVFGFPTANNAANIGVCSSANTAVSYLTGAPNVIGDIVAFDNSPIAWGIYSEGAMIGNRVQWPVGSDMEDWTGIGSGAEDLVDMSGTATRAFVQGDELLLATQKEIWRGRKVGGAYRFQFSPMIREMGIPFPDAAVKTPHGIFFLGTDYMVYRLSGGAIQPVGQAILQELRDTIYSDTEYTAAIYGNTHMSYDPRHGIVTLHYSNSSLGYGNPKAFSLHLLDGMKWTPQEFGLGIYDSCVANIEHGSKAFHQANFGSASAAPFGLDEVVYSGSTAVIGSSTVTTFGSVMVHSFTTNLDNGEPRESQYYSGGIFTGDNENMKLMTEVRVDTRADSSSNLSIAASGNLGGAFATEAEFAVSVQSNTSQTRVFPKVSGQYHQIRVTSEDTGWKLTRIGTKAQITGKAL